MIDERHNDGIAGIKPDAVIYLVLPYDLNRMDSMLRSQGHS